MNQRKKLVRLKIIVVILIDAFLFLLLVSIAYAFFTIPIRSETVGMEAFNPVPSETETEPPTETSTVEPSPTDTLEPTATDTQEMPSPTIQPTDTQTSTVEPSPTESPTSTTPPDTDTPEPSPTSTNEPINDTDTPTPSPTFRRRTPTPSATATMSVVPCPNCHIIKDFKELIISGLYTADLLNTEVISSTLNVTITLYNEYKGVVLGKAINMVDTQPSNEVMHVESSLWCYQPIQGEDYWIHTIASAQDNKGKLWFVVDEWMQITLSNFVLK